MILFCEARLEVLTPQREAMVDTVSPGRAVTALLQRLLDELLLVAEVRLDGTGVLVATRAGAESASPERAT